VRSLRCHWQPLDGLPKAGMPRYSWPLGIEHLQVGLQQWWVIVDKRQAPGTTVRPSPPIPRMAQTAAPVRAWGDAVMVALPALTQVVILQNEGLNLILEGVDHGLEFSELAVARAHNLLDLPMCRLQFPGNSTTSGCCTGGGNRGIRASPWPTPSPCAATSRPP
jgi:hypothetical protein